MNPLRKPKKQKMGVFAGWNQPKYQRENVLEKKLFTKVTPAQFYIAVSLTLQDKNIMFHKFWLPNLSGSSIKFQFFQVEGKLQSY